MCQSERQIDLSARPLKNIEGGFLVWKELGETPLETLERVRAELELGQEVKMTYAGRLDPAAQGKLMVLIGEACKQKNQYLGFDKTYRFQVLLGFETDTLDLLGIVNNLSPTIPKKISQSDLLQHSLNNFVGKHNWPYPAYSSKTLNGKHMWQYARDGKYTDLLLNKMVPYNDFEIYNLDYLGSKKIEGRDLLKHIEILVNSVSGDFRQSKIIKSWSEVIDDSRNFPLLEFQAKVSTGTYVRQIAENIGKKINSPAIAFSITRTEIHI